MRCFRCWRLGHYSTKCRNNRRDRPAHIPDPRTSAPPPTKTDTREGTDTYKVTAEQYERIQTLEKEEKQQKLQAVIDAAVDKRLSQGHEKKRRHKSSKQDPVTKKKKSSAKRPKVRTPDPSSSSEEESDPGTPIDPAMIAKVAKVIDDLPTSKASKGRLTWLNNMLCAVSLTPESTLEAARTSVARRFIETYDT